MVVQRVPVVTQHGNQQLLVSVWFEWVWKKKKGLITLIQTSTRGLLDYLKFKSILRCCCQAASPGQWADKVMFNPQAKKSRLGNLTAWVASEDISSGFIIQEDEEGVGERTEPPSWPRNGMDKEIYHKAGCAKNVRKLGKTLKFQRQRSYLFFLLCLPRITRCRLHMFYF